MPSVLAKWSAIPDSDNGRHKATICDTSRAPYSANWGLPHTSDIPTANRFTLSKVARFLRLPSCTCHQARLPKDPKQRPGGT